MWVGSFSDLGVWQLVRRLEGPHFVAPREQPLSTQVKDERVR
jgi:hypothetical protein